MSQESIPTSRPSRPSEPARRRRILLVVAGMVVAALVAATVGFLMLFARAGGAEPPPDLGTSALIEIDDRGDVSLATLR